MEILKFKRKISLKNKILISVAISLTVLLLITALIYIFSKDARDWMNIYILRKQVSEDDVATIQLEGDKTQYIYAYGRYISILCNGKLAIYNGYASKEAEMDLKIGNPIYDANHNYLAIAEKNGNKVSFIEDTRIVWENTIEGNITKVNVSRNGTVSVITTGTSYKSVIITFDKNGKELFKSYLASTIAIDTDVSVDGKYLAIAEVNTNGAIIESSIKIVEMEKAIKGNATESVVFKYHADASKLITDIKYQEKGQLVCIYDDSIHMIYQDRDTVLIEFNQDTEIADINLKSYIVRVEEISTGLFSAKTNIILTNIITGIETTYEVESGIKEIVCQNQITAINLGTEIEFIDLNGWLEKKYTSNQEAKDITLGTSIAGIIYRDRIKIITF